MQEAYKNPDLPIAQRVENLLSLMTFEEKVGQMLQLSKLPKEIKTIGRIHDYHLGSLLNVIGGGRTNRLQKAAEEGRLGIPLLFGIDAVHGHALWPGATVFPTQLSLSCTWNPDLIEEVGKVCAREMRATGVHWTFSPLLDVARDVRWGRINETFGEDPYLVSVLGAAIVRGYQGSDFWEGDKQRGDALESRVLACAKHFAGYSETQGGRDATEAELSRRKLMTTFLPPFEAAVKEGGCATIMTAYMAIDGQPTTRNTWLLRETLKGSWNFNGFVITDYDNVSRLCNEHFVCSNIEEASLAAIEGGNDMMMGSRQFYHGITDAFKGQGPINLTEEDKKKYTAWIDEAVRRILELKFRLGLFDNQRYVKGLGERALPEDDEEGEGEEKEKISPERKIFTDEEGEVHGKRGVVGCKEHKDVVLDTALQSAILLKNAKQLLPLKKEAVKKVAVVGPNADNMKDQLGDWVAGGRWAPVRGNHPKENLTTVLDGIKHIVGEGNVIYAKGCDTVPSGQGFEKDIEGVAEAVEAAKQADVAVVVVGDPMAWNGEQRDRADLDLTPQQRHLVEAIAATDTPVVLVLICGKPNAIPFLVENPKISAILASFNPGQSGGLAIARLIFSEANPCGRLTLSWPRHVGQLPVIYNHLPGWHAKKYIDMTPEPQWPFGFGLTYTTFEYSNLRLVTPSSTSSSSSKDKAELKEGETLKVVVDVQNTGDRQGVEVVQCYVRDVVSSVTTPVLQLKAFSRVALEPKEKKEVVMEIPYASLSLLNQDLQRVVEAGDFLVHVGPSSADRPLNATLHVL